MFPQSTKILIVDDSSFSRTMTRNGLKELKYFQVVEASTGLEAQILLMAAEHQREHIGLIISDIHMPGMTGLELLKWARGQESLTGIPVLLLTSSQDMNEIHEAGRAGVSHFLLKPLDMQALKERLLHAWTKHGQAYLKFRSERKPIE